MKRNQKILACSTCHKFGHNIRTCKYNLLQTEYESVTPQYHESSSSYAPTKLSVLYSFIYSIFHLIYISKLYKDFHFHYIYRLEELQRVNVK